MLQNRDVTDVPCELRTDRGQPGALGRRARLGPAGRAPRRRRRRLLAPRLAEPAADALAPASSSLRISF